MPSTPADSNALSVRDVRAFVDAVRTGKTRHVPAVNEDPSFAAVASAAASTHAYGGGPHVADPQVLELPAGAKWLEPSAASRLYVRPAYRVLLMLATAFLEQEREGEAPCQVLVTGAFGVGKTAFLSFALAQLCAQHDAPVVVLDVAGVFCRIAADGAVKEGAKGDSFADDLARRSTLYLCDATADPETWPLSVSARTIVTSAPLRRCFDGMAATTGYRTVTFAMPLWTTGELETCRAACFPHVSREHLVELVHLWGGAARWTLGTPRAASKAQFVRGASNLSLELAARLVRDHGIAMDDVVAGPGYAVDVHQVVHMDVGADNLFELESVHLCSSMAAALMLHGLKDGHVHEQLDAGAVVKGRIGDVFHRQIQQELGNRTALN